MNKRLFEFVIPAYNEAKNLNEIIERTLSAAKSFGLDHQNFNLIIVENGSRDDSKNILNQLLHNNPNYKKWMRVVHVPENKGYGILQGLKECKANIIGWTHADMQCDPRNAFAAFKILEGQSSNKILVKGSRLGRNWKDKFVSSVFKIFAHIILGINSDELNAQPKVFHSDLLHKINNPPFDFAFDLYLIYIAQKNKYETMSFSVYFPPRIHGASNWASNFLGRYKTILKMIFYMIELFFKEGRV